ncbi:FxsA family protein [Yinghuangia seranimata]|uniref:FxsA family protein n=1 Tax=Yinghuangia seranimata TaxID=408067 RepID=UPI00248B81FB|nr:FxsA family protein [Yinghuangia seranimata]MDI2129180.1 FxsA family protein [Yinghuangia seranimata]
MRRAAVLIPLVAFPIAEIYLMSRVSTAIGVGNTVLLLLAGVIAGALAIRYEGRRALLKLRASTEAAMQAAGYPASGAGPAPVPGGTPADPGRAAADAGLVVLGGVLLMIPGFISDVLGLLCVLPFTRPLVRRLIGGTVAGQVVRRTKVGGAAWQVREQVRMHAQDGKVVQGEVIDPDDARVWRPQDDAPGPGRLTG